jgi:hypothetical protein
LQAIAPPVNGRATTYGETFLQESIPTEGNEDERLILTSLWQLSRSVVHLKRVFCGASAVEEQILFPKYPTNVAESHARTLTACCSPSPAVS